MTEIDKDDVNALLRQIGPIVRDYLGTPPPSPERNFAVLNAAALMVAPILAAAPPNVRDWFATALDACIENFKGKDEPRQ